MKTQKSLITELKSMSKNELHDFIKKQLAFEPIITESIKHLIKSHNDLKTLSQKEHYRFDMSGMYGESKFAVCNNELLHKFAYLGIYDYTSFLNIDFYKGSGVIYYKYFYEDDFLSEEVGGLGTVEIIERIFQLTIFSGKKERRHD